jgi:TolB-like protein
VLNDQLSGQTAEPAKDLGSEKRKKKKDKVRSAWISFTGRIVAQIVGAVATVALGVTVLHKYPASDVRSRPGGDPSLARSVVSDSPTRSAGELSVAVLPLDNFSAEAGQEYFADGMTEALITDLSTVDGLHVISRTSSAQFKGQRKPLREIAQQLGVQWIVEGSVVRIGKRVRITAQLIDAVTDQHVWAASYDRSMTDVLALQAEMARAIAQSVSAALPAPGRQAAMLAH